MKTSYVFAALIALAAGGWVASGIMAEGGGQPEATKPPADLAAIEVEPSVRVRYMESEPRIIEGVVRGRTEASRKVSVRSETKGRVVELPVEEGDWVEEGDVMARLSADDRPARLREAKALREQRRIEFEASQKLSKKGFRADTQVAAARAALEAAEALVTLAAEELNDTVIRAPFAGLVDERISEIGDFLETGDPAAMIVDLDPMLVVAQVSEINHGKVRVGQTGYARLVDGSFIEGTVRYVSSVAEPATRTFRVELEVPNGSFTIADGLTAELRLPLDEVMAYHISPATLTLNDRGEIGVKEVTADGRVQFLPGQIVDSDKDGVWVSGLPGSLLLITVGQEFVKDGQRVRAIDEATLEPIGLGDSS
jgi:multidrug efflux system membrane fusion protein